jgi:hypothetical protein
MISLVIIAIMAMTIAPSLSEMLANNRQTAATMDLVRLGRKVRALAVGTGFAHLVRFRGAGACSNNGLGTLSVYVGMNGKCRKTPWDLMVEAGCRPRQKDDFYMEDYNPTEQAGDPSATDSDRQVIQLVAAMPAGTAETGLFVCFQPDGEVYTAAGSDPGNADNLAPQSALVEFQIRRSVDGNRLGRDRFVIFPRGGNARMR